MLLTIEGLTIAYREKNQIRNLVQRVSFSLDSGKILALVGESGSGKTLTGWALSGLLPPPLEVTGGRIIFQEKAIEPNSPKSWRSLRGSSVLYLFQSPMAALNPTLKIGRQISEALEERYGWDKREARNQAAALLDEVGISPNKAGNYPLELSGGMRQRVLLALALGLRPQLLIADEPFTGLDAVHQREILDLLEKLRRLQGTAILVISHDLRLVASWADRVAVMVKGEVVENITGPKLFQSPGHPYTRSLIKNLTLLEKSLSFVPAP
ncbi:MAG: ABC transporter ATP-binding protein [Pseudomonadota bacterium]